MYATFRTENKLARIRYHIALAPIMIKKCLFGNTDAYAVLACRIKRLLRISFIVYRYTVGFNTLRLQCSGNSFGAFL